MDFELADEQKRIQLRARAFAEHEVALVARKADEKGEFPHHLVKRMGELGFLAGPIEPEYGGAGMDYVSYALLCEELGRVDSSVPSLIRSLSLTLIVSCFPSASRRTISARFPEAYFVKPFVAIITSSTVM